jgi:hypothetical protein
MSDRRHPQGDFMKKFSLIVVAAGVLVASAASAQDERKCDEGSAYDMRRCMTSKIATARKAVDKRVTEICNKEVADAGKKGPAAVDARLASRMGRYSKILAGIN